MKKPIKQLPEPKPPPECPVWLTDAAKTEWTRVIAKLAELHILDRYDIADLAVYCQTYARWLECEAALKNGGLTSSYTNKAGASNLVLRPEAKLSISLQKQIKAFWAGVSVAEKKQKWIDSSPYQ